MEAAHLTKYHTHNSKSRLSLLKRELSSYFVLNRAQIRILI
jgi:hypothetical protein